MSDHEFCQDRIESLGNQLEELEAENEQLRAEREEILKSFRLKVEECAETLKENERLRALLSYWLPDETMVPKGHEAAWDDAVKALRGGDE